MLLEQTYHAHEVVTVAALEVAVVVPVLDEVLLDVAVVGRLVGTRLALVELLLVRAAAATRHQKARGELDAVVAGQHGRLDLAVAVHAAVVVVVVVVTVAVCGCVVG